MALRNGGRAERSRLRGWLGARIAVVAAISALGVAGTIALAQPAGAAVVPWGKATASAPGVLTGLSTVSNAPAGFSAEVDVVACRSTTSPASRCAHPYSTISGSGGSYALDLPAGSWRVTGFYTLGSFGGSLGGAFFGPSIVLVMTSGTTIRSDVSIPYQTPAVVTGAVTVTGVPKGVTITSEEVFACPAADPLVGTEPSVYCATGFVSPPYDLNLPAGKWILYVGYDTLFGLTVDPTGTAVTLHAGKTTTADLSVHYVVPTNGLIEGTVTVTGAPKGTSMLVGAGGCPDKSGILTLCPSPTYTLAGTGGAYQLAVPAGKWLIAGFYELAPFGGQFLSATHVEEVTGGSIFHLNLTIPYVKPATVTATVKVTGVPSGTTVESIGMLVCPTSSPYHGTIEPIECSFTSGTPSATLSIDTLPPGKFLVYPGYLTATSSLISTTGTPVALASGKTSHVALTVAYGSA
jgi:hypothetical protein